MLGDLVATPGARRHPAHAAEPGRRRRAARRATSSTRPTSTGARRATRSSSARSSPSPTSPLPESVRDAVLARTPGLSPEDAALHRAALLRPRRRQQRAARRPRPVGGRRSGRSRPPACSTGSGRGVAFRHEIARSAVLDAVAPGAESALHAAMIDALERIGGDASVLAHHAVAARDVGADPALRGRGRRPRRRGPGAHREAVAFYELALPHVADPAGKADLLEALSVELYLTDRLDDAIAAREQAVALRGDLADIVAVGAGHTAISPASPGTPPTWPPRYATRTPRSRSSPAPTTARALGFALAHHAFLAAQQGDTAEARAGRHARAAIARLGDAGAARHRVHRGRRRPPARGRRHGAGGPARGQRRGLRHRLDDLATTPMSNLCHHDVEQGRFDDAEESIAAEALRISEERDTPICTVWQLGVRARLRLLQDAGPRPTTTPAPCSLPGPPPRPGCGRTSCSACSPRARTRRRTTPTSTSCGGSSTSSTTPAWSLPAAAALAEKAWITAASRPAARPTRGSTRCFAYRRGPGRAALQAVGAAARRRRRAATSGRSPTRRPAADDRPTSRRMALWDAGLADDLLAALPLLDDLDARAVAALFRGQAARGRVSAASPAAGCPPPGPTRPGSPPVSSTCWPCSSKASATPTSPHAW